MDCSLGGIVTLGGYIFWVYVLGQLARILYMRVLRPATSFKEFKGEWAVVTGSSYGIGYFIALELAKRGMNVALLARSREKLEKLSKEIEGTYKVKTHIIEADLYKDPYEHIGKELADKQVSVLVNNAGGGVENPFQEYLHYSVEDEVSISKLNVHSVLRMTRLILPSMVNRRKGRIINVGSLSSLAGNFLAPYASDKAKINCFTEALAIEYDKYNVMVQCALAGKVSTPATFEIPVTLDCPSAAKFASDAIRLCGAGGPLLIPYWFHAFQAWMVSITPHFLAAKVVPIIYQNLKKEFDAVDKTKFEAKKYR